MPLMLFDTMTRELQPVVPSDGEKLRFYCCGPTVYGPAHIGNFRTFVVQDVLRRTLEASGMGTMHVRNITDVDDKTIRQSQAEGKTLADFTGYWLGRFHADCAALQLLPPHVEPGAVAHIPDQIALIDRLVRGGLAYESNGSVYFSVGLFRSYGRLSRLQEREITTSRAPLPAGPADADEYERDSAADFALWKARKPEDGPNFWPSPWGEGRPGWHIECSAMAMKYLGESMDLHGGGVDLVFPHHENEIAQSEASTGRVFARHWFHVTHLLVDDKKMSKSLGNLYTLEDLGKRGHTPAEVRYVLVSGHYRKPLNFTFDSLSAARSALQSLHRFEENLGLVSGKPVWRPGEPADGPFDAAWRALLEDLNTPKALGEVFTTVKALETKLREETLAAEEAAVAWKSWSRIRHAFGLDPAPPAAEKAPAEIEALAAERWEARQNKDFARSDVLRKELETRGWLVKDSKTGYVLTKA
jgi:cysteinyl-tRNA synthetase